MLQFRPVSGSAIATHLFSLAFKENGVALSGLVMLDSETGRPHGQLTLNCPEGDVTSAELDACTVWEGVIYAVDAAGAVSVLPAAESEAADQLILSGLAPWLRQSGAYGAKTLSRLPWDVFKRAGCALPR